MPRQTSERYTPLSIPSFIAETRFSQQGLRLLTRRAPETRRINYLARLLTEDSAAKEIKLFNLGGNLLGRYPSLFEKFFQEDKSLATRRAAVGFGLGLIATLGFYGSYAWIVWRTVQGWSVKAFTRGFSTCKPKGIAEPTRGTGGDQGPWTGKLRRGPYFRFWLCY